MTDCKDSRGADTHWYLPTQILRYGARGRCEVRRVAYPLEPLTRNSEVVVDATHKDQLRVRRVARCEGRGVRCDGVVARVVDVVLDQIDVWWGWFQRRMDGLSDDEYFWEPAPGCWTVRAQPDGRFSFDPWPEAYWPPLSPPPVTTIAWRLAHMSSNGRLRKYGFADEGPSPSLAYEGWPDWGDADPADCPGSANAALQRLAIEFDRWRTAIAGLDEDRLWEPIGDREGVESMRLGVSDPFINVAQHINREWIHHGAEVALLRDLYRAQVLP